MQYIKLNEKTYGYTFDFKDNDEIRNGFNSLTRKTYGFDFEEWYQNGYWKNGYIPYAMLDGKDVVSNVSVNVIDFFDNGDKKRYIQIGTVMTDEKYRKQGLNRSLMEKVLEKWKGKCDLIYLFANDSVLEFYPKFGFISLPEYQHSKKILSNNSTSKVIKLNMSDEKDKTFLIDKINKSVHFSKFAMYNNESLIMFYCTSFMNQSVYYIKVLDVIVIAEFENDMLYLNDVFCSKNISLDDVIAMMANISIKKVVMGFTPKDTTSFDVMLLKEDDTTLFVIEDNLEVLKNRKIMFPILSHA